MLAALEKFKEMGPQKTQAITYEIAMLGRSGLKQLDPKLDSGIDLDKEYEAALEMFRQEGK
jgi:hypothetical protein